MYHLKHLHILRAPNLVGMVTFPGKYRARKKPGPIAPGHVNFDLGQVKIEVLVACWAIEISLSGPVSLSESVSLVHVNNNFQTETNSKLMTAR